MCNGAEEAYSIYSSIFAWTRNHPKWIVGGDLNETRRKIDRDRTSNKAPRQKFIDLFLEDTNAIDIWRHLYPTIPGFTYRQDQGGAHSRIDYFLAAPSLLQVTRLLQMNI